MKLEDKYELKRRDLGLTLWKEHYSTLINHKHHGNGEYISSSLTWKVDITTQSMCIHCKLLSLLYKIQSDKDPAE